MSKRGNAEVAVLVTVLFVAVFGLYFVLNEDNSAFSFKSATGGFAVPAAKEYGGAVRGVSISGTRAFPAGRAFEMPEQSCYTCSCLEQGITSANREAAERVCADNCNGRINNDRPGEC